MEDKVTKNWLKLLDPIATRKNLMLISVMITAYEFLNESIVENLSSLYLNRIDEKGRKIYSDDYIREVLSLKKNKKEFDASIKWFLKENAINSDDVNTIYCLREHRNKLTHESIRFLSDSDQRLNLKYLHEVALMLNKIEKWWIKEIEVPTNIDISTDMINEIDFDGCKSMRMMVLELLIITVTDYSRSETLHEIFKDLSNN